MDERFTVFARDKASYKYLLSAKTKATVLLDHDMALRLSREIFKKKVHFSNMEWNILQSLYQKIKGLNRAAYLMRQDKESIQNYPTDLDLSKCFYLTEYASKDWIYFGAQMMLSAIDSFDTIITDRLHVGIAGLLMGKEMYLLDNSYHKIQNIYLYSLTKFNNVHLCPSVPTRAELKIKKTATHNLKEMIQHIKN